jgi:flagellar protein FliO/FliZ
MMRCRSLLAAIASPALAFATLTAIVVALTNALFIGAAHAQVATAPTPAPAAPASSPFVGMMQGLVGLAVVVAMIFAAAWLMKKIGPRARSGGVVQIVGGASVGPREKVVVVRFAGQTLLLGVAPGQVSLLHTAEPGTLSDASTTPPDAAGQPSFLDRLRATRGGT